MKTSKDKEGAADKSSSPVKKETDYISNTT